MFVEANIQVSWPDWQELPVTSLLCAHRQNATQPSTGMTARVSSTNVTSRMSLGCAYSSTHISAHHAHTFTSDWFSASLTSAGSRSK